MIKKVNDFTLGIGMILVSIFLIFSPEIVQGAVNNNVPGGFWARPDVYIRIIACIMIIPSIILVFKSISFKKDSEKQKFKFDINSTIVISLGLIVLYTITLPIIGFVISSLIMVFCLCALYTIKEQNLTIRDIDKKKLSKILIKSTIYSVISVVALYFIFTIGLSVQLP